MHINYKRILISLIVTTLMGCASNVPYKKEVKEQNINTKDKGVVWVFWQKADEDETVMGKLNTAMNMSAVKIYVDDKKIDETLYWNTHAVLLLKPGKRKISFLTYSQVAPLALMFGKPSKNVNVDVSEDKERYVVYVNSSNNDGSPSYCDKGGCYDGYMASRNIIAFERGNIPPAMPNSTKQFTYIEELDLIN